MGCIITFDIQGKSEAIDIDRLPTSLNLEELSVDSIAKVLIQNSRIQEQLSKAVLTLESTNEPITAETIKDQGIVGNTNFQNIKILLPGSLSTYEFKENPSILLVNNLAVQGASVKDMIYKDSQGRRTYIVRNNNYAMRQFATFLKTKDLVKTKFQGNERLANLLDKIKLSDDSTPKTQTDVLLDFLENNAHYKTQLSNEGLYGLLDGICRKLQNDNALTFENPLAAQTYSFLQKYPNNIVSLTKKELAALLEVKTIANDEETLTQAAKELINKIKDSPLKLEFSSIYFNSSGSPTIYFKNNSFTLSETQNYTYDTIDKFLVPQEVYKGFIIYKDVQSKESPKYYYSQGLLSPNTSAKSYSSIEELKQRIDSKQYDKKLSVFSPEFYYEANTPFKLYLQKNSFLYPAKSTFKKYKTTLTKYDSIDQEYNSLLTNGTLEDFYTYFSERGVLSETFDKLKEVIDSPELAGLFIYKLYDKQKRNTTENQVNKYYGEELEDNLIKGILEELSNAKTDVHGYNYYYVVKQGNKMLQLEPITDIGVSLDAATQRPMPIIGHLNTAIKVLQDTYEGLEIELITNSEAKDMGVDEDTRAFIKDGKVYINQDTATSADVFHEYTHLLLGVLKASNFDGYVKLLNTIASIKKDKWVGKVQEEVRAKYKGRSEMDIQEEVFATLFGDYLAGKRTDLLSEELTDAMKQTKNNTDKALSKVFEGMNGDDINTIYKGTIYDVCKGFMSAVANYKNGLEFKKGRVYRQISNVIEKMKNDNIIQEECK